MSTQGFGHFSDLLFSGIATLHKILGLFEPLADYPRFSPVGFLRRFLKPPSISIVQEDFPWSQAIALELPFRLTPDGTSETSSGIVATTWSLVVSITDAVMAAPP